MRSVLIGLLSFVLLAGCAKPVQPVQNETVPAQPVLKETAEAPAVGSPPETSASPVPSDAIPVTPEMVDHLLRQVARHDYTFRADGETVLIVRTNGDYAWVMGQGFLHQGLRAWQLLDGVVVDGPYPSFLPQLPGLNQVEGTDPRDLSILAFLQRLRDRGKLYRTAAEPDVWQASGKLDGLSQGDLPRWMRLGVPDEILNEPVDAWRLRVMTTADLPRSFTVEATASGNTLQFIGSYVWDQAPLPAVPADLDPPDRQLGLAGMWLGAKAADTEQLMFLPMHRPLPDGGEWIESEDGSRGVEVQGGRIVRIRLKEAKLLNGLVIGRSTVADVLDRYGPPPAGSADSDRLEYRTKGGYITYFVAPDRTLEAGEALWAVDVAQRT